MEWYLEASEVKEYVDVREGRLISLSSGPRHCSGRVEIRRGWRSGFGGAEAWI